MSGPPEEPENGDPGRDEGGADPDEPESPLRGWIDPDDRLWRHPSEQVPAVPPAGVPAGGGAGPVLSPPPKRSWRGPLMVSIGAVAVIAVGAFVYVLLSPAAQPPLQSSGRDDGNATLTTDTGATGDVPPAAQTAAESVVELQADTSQGTVHLLGVAVAEGGMVATTAGLLTDVRSIAMVGAGGKLEQASVVGTDTTSDVALVQVPEDLPVAPFADDANLAGGAPDMVLGLAGTSGGGAGVALRETPGSVTAVATDIASGPADGMDAIVSSPPLTAGAAGDPLLDAGGSVVGLLCDPQAAGASATASAATFLPTQLVVGVADDLRSGNRVVPGWLGVKGSDAAGGAGAKVDGTYANSPAATHLQAGEVIVAVNTQPVRSFAELRSRLYVEPPGSSVNLSVQGVPGVNGTKAVVVTLTSDS